jgi:hypothetical protein
MTKKHAEHLKAAMRPEYDLSQLRGKVRGKYVKRFEIRPDLILLNSDATSPASLIGLPIRSKCSTF